MVDEKSPNPMGNWRRKPKDQSDKKPPNLVGDWGGKLKDQWQCIAHR